jgi:hypothetical protein
MQLENPLDWSDDFRAAIPFGTPFLLISRLGMRATVAVVVLRSAIILWRTSVTATSLLAVPLTLRLIVTPLRSALRTWCISLVIVVRTVGPATSSAPTSTSAVGTTILKTFWSSGVVTCPGGRTFTQSLRNEIDFVV